MKGLRNGHGQVLSLQRCQGCAENCIGAAKFAQEFACRSGTQPRRQGQGQPAHVIVEMHREGNQQRLRTGQGGVKVGNLRMDSTRRPLCNRLRCF